MLRVRFAPSPTGYLHIGSARTFIFNWLYARPIGGTMILRIDDTDVERNTQASLDSIFDGLNWLDLVGTSFTASPTAWTASADWRRRFSRRAWPIAISRRRFVEEKEHRTTQRGLALQSRDARAFAGRKRPPRRRRRAVRAAVPRAARELGQTVAFHDLVYGAQSKATADIEDFALLRSNGMPTYHMASCADDADLRISHIIRGQDHLTNTFKHVLIFEALGVKPPQFAHLPLLIAPDGSKLSKRKHGPVVSVTTYRDAGFLPHALHEFPVPAGLVAEG